MNKAFGKLKYFVYLQLLLLMIFSMPGKTMLLADNFTDRRVHVGLKLFRTIVSADLNIKQKIDNQGNLSLTLIYTTNLIEAEKYYNDLQTTFTSVDKIKTDFQLKTIEQMIKANTKTAAIFIAQSLNEKDLKTIVDYGIKNQIVIFSPFEGDVEQGVLSGLSVQATVRPMINMNTLKLSQLSIKPFYLKVAKQYE